MEPTSTEHGTNFHGAWSQLPWKSCLHSRLTTIQAQLVHAWGSPTLQHNTARRDAIYKTQPQTSHNTIINSRRKPQPTLTQNLLHHKIINSFSIITNTIAIPISITNNLQNNYSHIGKQAQTSTQAHLEQTLTSGNPNQQERKNPLHYTCMSSSPIIRSAVTLTTTTTNNL